MRKGWCHLMNQCLHPFFYHSTWCVYLCECILSLAFLLHFYIQRELLVPFGFACYLTMDTVPEMKARKQGVCPGAADIIAQEETKNCYLTLIYYWGQ